MKLTVFSAETLPVYTGGHRSTIAKISFSKSGLIALNKKAVELMDLNAGQNISLAQDDDAQWYVYKDKSGFPLRLHPKNGTLMFNHIGLKNMFCESLGVDPKIANKFLVAGQPTVFDKVKYWGILIGA